MATKATQQNQVGGVGQSPSNIGYPPILAKVDPTPFDQANIGQTWINEVGNTSFTLTSISLGAANWETTNGGDGEFTNITVTGNLTVDGDSTFNNSVDIAAGGLSVTDTFFAHEVVIAAQGQAFITAYKPAPVGTPTTTVAIPTTSPFFSAVFTGFTTAAGAQQRFTITNANVTTSSVILATASNLGTGQMAVCSVLPAAGSVVITLQNFDGAAALNNNVTINGWILQY